MAERDPPPLLPAPEREIATPTPGLSCHRGGAGQEEEGDPESGHEAIGIGAVSVAEVKFTPKRSHQTTTEESFSRSASAGIS